MLHRIAKLPLLLCLSATVLVAADSATDSAPAPPRHPLEPFGYGPAAADVRRCLAQFVPAAQRQARISELLAKLGDAQFAVREQAYAELARMPLLPRALLQAAAANAKDLEIKGRIEQLLKNGPKKHTDQLLHAALRQIIQLKLEGLTPDVLAATKSTDFESFWPLLGEALLIGSTSDDQEVLAAALSDNRPDLRATAAKALVHVQGAKAAEHILPLLADSDDRVSLVAAKLLANIGHRDCFAALLRLLEADKIGLRLGAVTTLRKLSGQKFGYRTTSSNSERQTAITAWKTWVAGPGKTAKLNFPIEQ
jgi:hypothetical protein